MKKCKWAGDVNDEYCKNCDGIEMEVDGNVASCKDCAGYEPGTEDVEVDDSPDMNSTEADKEVVEKEPMNPPAEEVPARPTAETKKPSQNKKKDEKVSKSTSKTENVENKPKSSSKKVAETKKAEEKTETSNGEIKVVAIRYMSGATIVRGDNYFKFTAEEEWDVSQISDVDEAREKLWAKLNSEIDAQIEELSNL
jgi:hypothetical protein